MNLFKITVLAASLSLVVRANSERYTLTDLGPMTGTNNSYGAAVNDSGQVVGFSNGQNGNGEFSAFIWSNGTFTNLGTLGGGTFAKASGINDSGLVVGQSDKSNGNRDAFLYDGVMMHDLGTLGGSSSVATGINAAGQVVGQALNSGGDSEAFLYTGGTMMPLGFYSSGISSFASGLSATGVVTGYATTVLGANQAFLYSGGSLHDIGTLGGNVSLGNGIDASSGIAVGSSFLSDNVTVRAFLYTGGVMLNLGALAGDTASSCLGVNSSGDAVGYSSHGSTLRAFLYSGGTMTDLNTLVYPSTGGFTLQQANGISENGYIVGTGIAANGQTHAFLLTPVPVPIYEVIDLGTLGGNYSEGNGINGVDRVCGSSYLSDNATTDAFLWSNGRMHDLGTLGGNYTYAAGINVSSQVVGCSYLGAYPSSAFRGFVYSNGVMKELDTLAGPNSFAEAINDAGSVTGYSTYAGGGNGSYHAFLLLPPYNAGTMKDLGALYTGDTSVPYAINRWNKVAGGSNLSPSSDYGHACVWFPGGSGPVDLGTLGGGGSAAYGLNDSGQVVGYSDISGNEAYHAFIYSDGVMEDLGTLSGTHPNPVSFALGINNSGWVVGWSNRDADVNSLHAFLCIGHTMYDLNDFVDSSGAAWFLEQAFSIADNGDITGNGTINGQEHAFLLRRKPSPIGTAQPKP